MQPQVNKTVKIKNMIYGTIPFSKPSLLLTKKIHIFEVKFNLWLRAAVKSLPKQLRMVIPL